MQVVSSAKALRAWCDAQRTQGWRVGLVPTMGYLHEGHLSLIDRARALSDKVVVTIFVNPTQFAPTEDLQRYPRDLAGDLTRCQTRGSDLVFTPSTAEMYPPGFCTQVAVPPLSRQLCGVFRPEHFQGVCTVVAKLFHIVGPSVALFGEKDYQQLQIIRRMAIDLNFPVEVVGAPIVREPDGLAMSSRNAYLSPDERRSAATLFCALRTAQATLHDRGRLSDVEIYTLAQAIIDAAPHTRIQYITLCDPETLAPRDEAGPHPALLALAVFVGQTRLIDNAILSTAA